MSLALTVKPLSRGYGIIVYWVWSVGSSQHSQNAFFLSPTPFLFCVVGVKRRIFEYSSLYSNIRVFRMKMVKKYICMASRWLLKYSDTGISDKVFKYSDTAISGKVSFICTASHVLIYLLFFILISKRCFVPISSLFQQQGWTVE